MCGVLPLQAHDLWASNGGDALISGASQLIGFFRNLEWMCEMKIEDIRGLNRNLNDGWYFRKLLGIRKLVRKLPHFAT